MRSKHCFLVFPVTLLALVIYLTSNLEVAGPRRRPAEEPTEPQGRQRPLPPEQIGSTTTPLGASTTPGEPQIGGTSSPLGASTTPGEPQIGGTTSPLGTAPPVYELMTSERQPAVTSLSTSASEQTLQCPTYAGPMFLPYYPGAKKVPVHSVRAAALPGKLEEQPRAQPGVRVPLIPFELHTVRLEATSRFGVAQQTNAAFLKYALSRSLG